MLLMLLALHQCSRISPSFLINWSVAAHVFTTLYTLQSVPGKTLRNDLSLCVERDVKLYSLRAGFSFLTGRLTMTLTGQSSADAFLDLLTDGQMSANCNQPISAG